MSETIGYEEVSAMLLCAAKTVKDSVDLLTKLDSVIGDGDHGTSVARAMDAIDSTIGEDQGSPVKDLLFNVSWAVMSIDGGSTGPLLGSFFTGMSEAADESMDCAGAIAMFEGGATQMQETSKASVGDKTMMDALLPAIEALKSAGTGGDLKAALTAAAEAAATGAESTKDMVAKFGRARNLGDRVLGHIDPGSKSMSLLWQGFRDGLPA